MGEMDQIRDRLIHIHGCAGIGWKTIAKFFEYDHSLSSIYQMTETELQQFFAMQRNHISAFYRDLHQRTIKFDRRDIQTITFFDNIYPGYLKDIYDPPWVLYCKGDLSLLKEPRMLSVVGTRRPSNSGIQAMHKLLGPMIEQGWGVVSGLAEGIDSAAHRLALNSRTIAVLGSGFDHLYPKRARPLADEIAITHLLISEYPPERTAKPWQFPFRNRIISGLTRGTLVVEAREKSGSLITADQALEQGREVFAVPGSVFDSRAVGTNRLIQQGAKLVLTSEDLFEDLQ